MSSIDTRTVKMNWDAADFQKGCENTTKMLQQMQQTLNNLNGKAANINVDGLNAAADAVTSKFSVMGTFVDQIFRNIADRAVEVGKTIVSAFTIDPLKSGFAEYQQLIDSMKVIDSNLNLGRKLVLGDEEDYQQWELLANGQVGDKYSLFGKIAKWQEREQTSMATIEGYLDDLNEYADKTIYNFNDMADAIGKFINAGVDNLDDATAAIKGLSNLAALSGATSEQTSRAMYNASQVLSTGTLRLMDYRQFTMTQGLGKLLNDALIQSLDDLGYFEEEIVTEDVTQEVMKAWKKSSKYKELNKGRDEYAKGDFPIDPEWFYKMYQTDNNGNPIESSYRLIDGHVYTDTPKSTHTFADNNGKTISVQEILKQLSESNGNFSNLLKYNVVTDEVFLHALELFSDENTELGQAAIEAATQVRSSKQLWDVLTEAAGTGWSESWRHIIAANPEEATQVWTGLYKAIGPVIENTAKARNEMLKFWHDNGGRTAAIKGISALYKTLTGYIAPLTKRWDEKSVWGQLTSTERGKVLRKYTNDFRRWAMHLEVVHWRLNALRKAIDLLHMPLDWLGSFFENGGGKNILSSLGHISDILLKLTNIEGKAITRLFADTDVGRMLADMTGVLDEFFAYAENRLKEGKDGANKIIYDFFQMALDPLHWILQSIQNVDLNDVLNILKDALDVTLAVGDAITDGWRIAMEGIDTGMLAEFVEWLRETADSLKEYFESNEGFAWISSSARAIFSFFRMGFDLIVTKVRLILDVTMQIFEAAQPFISKYITPLLNFLGPIFNYVGKIAIAFERWVRESEIVKRIFTTLFDGLGKGIDAAIDRINSILKVFGVQLPKLTGENAFDPMKFFGDPDEWVPKLMNKIVDAFTGLDEKLKNGGIGLFSGDLFKFEEGSFLDNITSGISEKIETLRQSIAPFISSLMQGFDENGILGAIGNGVSFVITKVQEGLATLMQSGGPLQAISDLFTGLFGGKKKKEEVSNDGGMEAIAEDLEKEGVKIVHGFGFLDAFKQKATEFLEVVDSLLYDGGNSKFYSLLQKGGDLYGLTLVYNIINTLLTKLGAFNQQINGFSLALTGAITNVSGSMSGMFTSFGDGWKTFTQNISGGINTFLTTTADTFSKTIPGLMKNVSKGVKQVMKSFAKGLPKLMKSLGKGIQKALDGLGKMFEDVGKGAEKYLKGKAFNERAEGILKIAAAIGVLAASLWLISTIPEDKVKMAVGILLTLMGAFALVAIVVGLFAKTTDKLFGVSQTVTDEVAPQLDKMKEALAGFLKKAGIAVLVLAFAGAVMKLVKAVKKLSEIPGDKLLAGTAAVTVLVGALAAAVIAIDKFGSQAGIGKSIGNLITMIGLSIAIGAVAKAVIKIGKLDEKSILNATVCLSALMVAFSLMAAFSTATRNTKFFGIIALTIAISVMAGAVKSLSKLKPEKLIPATICIGVLMGLFSLMEAMAGKIQNGKTLAGIVLMGVLVAALAFVLYKLTELPSAKALIAAASLTAVLLGVSAAMVAASIIGKTGVGGLIGIGLILLFIAAFTALLTGIGALFNSDESGKMLAGLKTGVKVMRLLGKAIGEFIGEVIGNFLRLVMDNIGEGLEEIGESIKNFCNSIAQVKLNRGSLKALKDLAGAMLALTGAELLNGLASFMSFGKSPYKKFADGIEEIAPPLTRFSKKVGNVGESTAKTAGYLAKCLGEFAANLPRNGGLIQKWITGDNSLKTFSEGLDEFSKPMVKFLTRIGNAEFNDETIERGIKMAGVLTAWAKEIPNDGGLLGMIVGNNDIGSFGEGLAKFTGPFIEFINSINGATIDEAVVDKSKYAVDSIIAWSKKLPNNGGLLGMIVGNNDLGGFAEGLEKVAPALMKYSIYMEHFNSETVKRSSAAVETIMTFANQVPDNQEGSLFGLLFGSNSLDTFGENLAAFGGYLVQYAKAVEGITKKQLDAMKRMTPAVENLLKLSPLLPQLGGLFEAFTGEKSFEATGKDLLAFAVYMNKFFEYLPSVEESKFNDIDMVGEAVKKITGLYDGLQSLGSIFEIFTGEKSLEATGRDAANFASFMKVYVDNVPEVTQEDLKAVDDVKGLINKLYSIEPELPKLGGVFDAIHNLFTGDQSLASFGEWMGSFGQAFGSYSQAVSNLNFDNMYAANDVIRDFLAVLDEVEGKNNATGFNSVTAINDAQNLVYNIIDTIKTELEDEGNINETEAAAENIGKAVVNGLNGGYYQLESNESSAFSTKGTTIASNFIDNFKTVIDKDTSMKGSLYSAMDTVMSTASSRVDREYETFKSLGEHLISGVIVGVNNRSSDLYTVMHNVAVNAYNAAANAVQAHSPARKFIKLGEFCDLGLIKGVKNYSDDVDRVLVNTMTAPLKTLDAIMNNEIELNPMIQPTLDLSMVRAGAGQLNGFFSDRSIRLAEINDQLQNQSKWQKAQMSQQKVYNDKNVITAITGLNDNIHGVQDAISNMYVSIDGKKTVGYISNRIDQAMGATKNIARRGRL